MNPSIHRRDRTSATPALSSRQKCGWWSAARAGRCGSLRATRKAALTRKVAASTAIATPGLSATMSTPAAAGPSTWPAFMASAMSEFACCSSRAGTRAGMSPPAAGRKNASSAP